MNDAHLRILRVAARQRARQLRDAPAEPDATTTETPEAGRRRRVELQRLAVRARLQLSDATARRRRDGR